MINYRRASNNLTLFFIIEVVVDRGDNEWNIVVLLGHHCGS